MAQRTRAKHRHRRQQDHLLRAPYLLNRDAFEKPGTPTAKLYVRFDAHSSGCASLTSSAAGQGMCYPHQWLQGRGCRGISPEHQGD